MSIRRRFSRRFLAGALTLPLVISGLGVLTPGVAEAAACYQSWTDKDPSGYGYGKRAPNEPYTITVRTGIYGECDPIALVDISKKLLYHCYRRNSYGNTWTHVRVEGTTIRGWVWDGNLSNNGSIYIC